MFANLRFERACRKADHLFDEALDCYEEANAFGTGPEADRMRRLGDRYYERADRQARKVDRLLDKTG